MSITLAHGRKQALEEVIAICSEEFKDGYSSSGYRTNFEIQTKIKELLT